MENNKSSLAKSHSGWSNTKLTVVCLLSILFVTCLWAVIILKDKMPSNTVFYVLLGVSGGLTLISLILFSRFKR